jgi:hypothetical protein
MQLVEKRDVYSASVVDLDCVPVGIREIGMRKHAAVIASGEQSAPELTDRCDDAFVLLHVWQHVSEVAQSALHARQIFLELSLRLSRVSLRNP